MFGHFFQGDLFYVLIIYSDHRHVVLTKFETDIEVLTFLPHEVSKSNLGFPSPHSNLAFHLLSTFYLLQTWNQWVPALNWWDLTWKEKYVGPGEIWAEDLPCCGVAPETVWPPWHPYLLKLIVTLYCYCNKRNCFA